MNVFSLNFFMNENAYFNFYSIDGRHNERLGRYLNDAPGKRANCVSKAVFLLSKPRVLFFAARDIIMGSELTYDYKGYDLPWRKKVGII
jgi:SET domain-containing protein